MSKQSNKPIIQFSHANGFPAPTYRYLFKLLEPHFEIQYIERLAHDPNHPVTNNWQSITSELIREHDKHKEPVIGIGHSLGGAITLFAAIERPEIISAHNSFRYSSICFPSRQSLAVFKEAWKN